MCRAALGAFSCLLAGLACRVSYRLAAALSSPSKSFAAGLRRPKATPSAKPPALRWPRRTASGSRNERRGRFCAWTRAILSSFRGNQFANPHGLVVGPEGNVWIADTEA